jgi:multiple sugar transport system ATP-binding protein
MTQIRVHQLHKAFAEFTAVQDSSFTVKDGEFFCLLGPSGCGKTTTLRMIAGLELPTSGQVFLGDEDVSFKRASARDIAFVFQMFALYPHMNVRQNMGFPLVSQGLPRAEVQRRVQEAAGILQISALLDSPVSGLSSGDRQRVALGRAIVRQPLAFLMDEPLGALDAEFREVMCVELRALHDRLKATTVVVTHDQTEAMAMADTIAVMNKGLIEQLGPPMDVYERPASVFVADFIGSPAMNFLPCTFLPGTFLPSGAALARGTHTVQIGGAQVAVPTLRQDVPNTPLLCGVRPEHIRFDDASALRAEVLGTEYLGTSQVVTLRAATGASAGTTLRAKVAANSNAQRGDQVGLRFEASAVSLFDPSTGRALRTARDDAAAHTSNSAGTHHG